MAEYQRTPQRFFCQGISLLPADALAAGKLPFAQNIRSYEEGTIQPRYGLAARSSAALSGAVLSIIRLNDPTPYASRPALRFIGTSGGGRLYAAPPADAAAPYPEIDSGYSGNPLSGVVTVPSTSPQPWLYIGDSVKQRKYNVNGLIYPIGTAQPAAAADEPIALLQPPGVTVISELNSAAAWTEVGAIAAAPSDVARVATTISAVVYDSGGTGYASIGATDMANIGVGARLALASAEIVLVTDVLVAITTTTIAQIVYDAGTTGLCTIQPVASLGTGQLDGPSYQDYLGRTRPVDAAAAGIAGTTPQATARVRQVDFPVNCLVQINGGEVVRILSVALGKDGVQSFRCRTAGTATGGMSLVGVPGFRAATTGTRGAGDAIDAEAIQQVLTPVTQATVVGGVQAAALAVNLATINGRATLPDDDLHLSFRADLLSVVTEIRIYLDVNAAAVNFTDNYYQYAWRANDIISAIQGTNAATTSTIQDARQDAILQNQIDQAVQPTPGVSYAQPKTDDSALGRPTSSRAPTTPTAPGQPGRATALTATSGQLALGNNQWIELKCKIRDLTRVGTDASRTLANVGGVQVLVAVALATTPVTVQYNAAWIQGGFGADVGDTATPYVWCYRFRSSLTGAVSNPSAPTRGGVVPRRQRVTLTGSASGDAQIDLVDWFRLGGALTGWTYTGTVPVSTAYNDDNSDSAIDGGESLRFDFFQPWPVWDLPRRGTGTIAGTALVRETGDAFNAAWAPGTAITVNGQTTTLYASPSTADLLHVAANCGTGNGISWTIKEPTILARPLPALWGGPIGGNVFLFACGDTTDPGSIKWTHGNNPEVTSDANWLSITSGSEPLQHGCLYDGTAFVFSTENLYRLEPAFDRPSTFTAQETACGRGLWTRWAFCLAPEGIYFLAKDGIYLTAWGAPAQAITDPDLRVLFPNDGTVGSAMNGIDPPDMTLGTTLRLSYVDGTVYFDYHTTGSPTDRRTLLYETATKRWFYDRYARSGITIRAWEPGSGVHDQILGAADGQIYQYLDSALIDVDTPIDYAAWTPWADGGDARRQKRFGDVFLNVDPGAAVTGITVIPTYNDGESTLAPQVIGTGLTGRQPLIVGVNGGDGQLARNLGVQIAGQITANDHDRPLFYLWEPSFLAKVESVTRRGTDWDNLGYQGAKFVQGMILRADTFGAAKLLTIEYDGGTAALTIAATHAGEIAIAYPHANGGWAPFMAELVRLVGADDLPWQLYDVRWVYEPAPDAATEWRTQPTTHDLPGYLSVRDMLVAHQSTAELTLTVSYTGGPVQIYAIPASLGAYARTYVVMQAGKGRAVTYRLTSTQPFRLFQKDMSVRVQGWGVPSGYLSALPFGGPSRAAGAQV